MAGSRASHADARLATAKGKGFDRFDFVEEGDRVLFVSLPPPSPEDVRKVLLRVFRKAERLLDGDDDWPDDSARSRPSSPWPSSSPRTSPLAGGPPPLPSTTLGTARPLRLR